MSRRHGRCRSCLVELEPRHAWRCRNCGARIALHGPLAVVVAVVILLVVLGIFAVAMFMILDLTGPGDDGIPRPTPSVAPDAP